MFGTSNNTYTTPGITSELSKSRQSGPLQLITTDTNGNLAADGGAVFKGLAKAQAGIAMALALEAPSLAGAENFGMRVGWGNYDGEANGIALNAIGVLCRNCLAAGDRIALDGGVAMGTSQFMTYSSGSVISGRAGLQWTWK